MPFKWAILWENWFELYTNKIADQPEHPCSLISVFVICCLDSIFNSYSCYIQNLTWLHNSRGRLLHDLAQKWFTNAVSGENFSINLETTVRHLAYMHGRTLKLFSILVNSLLLTLEQWHLGKFIIKLSNETSSPKGNDRSPESNVPTSFHFKQASK